MNRNNLMGLFETQEYISSESHEWDVPLDAKDKIERMVQKYNERAIKICLLYTSDAADEL